MKIDLILDRFKIQPNLKSNQPFTCLYKAKAKNPFPLHSATNEESHTLLLDFLPDL
jgi:hypothetical protein